jgi:hypothetical protein
MSSDQNSGEADGAFAARVEIMLRAAENGDRPTAVGMLAGMSDEELERLEARAAKHGALFAGLLAIVPDKSAHPAPVRRRPLAQPKRRTVFGNAALADADHAAAQAAS